MLGIQVAKQQKVRNVARFGCLQHLGHRKEAKKRLPKGIFEYIDRGAEDEIAVTTAQLVNSNLLIGSW